MENMSNIYTPAQTGKARVFIILNRARFDHDLTYASYAKLAGISHSHGEITPVEIPNPDEFDSYLEVDEISGDDSRYTSSLVAKFPAAIRSLLQYLDRCKAAFDIHLQLGDCENPGDPGTFSKGEILEHVRVTGYNTDDMGSLQGDEGSEVRETLAISFRAYYDYVRMSYFTRAGDLVTTKILDVAAKKTPDCLGDSCVDEMFFAVTEAAGGSPGTPPDLLWTIDKGKNWYAHDIEDLDTAEDATGVADVGGYVIVISETAVSLCYTELEQFYYPTLVGWDPEFEEITTGFVEAPLAIVSTGLIGFIAAAAGYVYSVEEPSAGVKVLDAGVAAGGNDLNAIDAYDSKHIVAVGDNGIIVYATDGESFDLAPSTPLAVATHFTGVAMRNASEWLVIDDAGDAWITVDSGIHWTEIELGGTAPTKLTACAWQGESVGFIAGVVGGVARVYRTLTAGNTWIIQPQAASGAMPDADSFDAMAISPKDPNFILLGGDLDGSDGILVVGKDSAT